MSQKVIVVPITIQTLVVWTDFFALGKKTASFWFVSYNSLGKDGISVVKTTAQNAKSLIILGLLGLSSCLFGGCLSLSILNLSTVSWAFIARRGLALTRFAILPFLLVEPFGAPGVDKEERTHCAKQLFTRSSVFPVL